MAYCSSVPGFAGFEEPTVEVENEDTADGELQVAVRVVRPCSGCGNDQAELTLEFATSFDHECPEGGDYTEEEDDRTYEIVGSVDAEPVDEYQTTDRRGKPIRNARYQRHLIGASISATVKCSCCEEEFEVTDQQTEAASSFEDAGSH